MSQVLEQPVVEEVAQRLKDLLNSKLCISSQSGADDQLSMSYSYRFSVNVLKQPEAKPKNYQRCSKLVRLNYPLNQPHINPPCHFPLLDIEFPEKLQYKKLRSNNPLMQLYKQ